MSFKKGRPRAAATANTGGKRLNIFHDNPHGTREQDRFPWCRLFRHPIIHGFFAACPISQPNPFHALQEIQDRAYYRLAPGAAQDVTGGLDDLERAKRCGTCICGGIAMNPHVKRLREQAGLEGER